MLYTEHPFLERFAIAARDGFSAVEYHFPYGFRGEDIKARLEILDLVQVLFNLHPGDKTTGEWGTLSNPRRRDYFHRSLTEALELATFLKCTRLNTMFGKRVPGVERGEQISCAIENLSWAAPLAAQAGVTLLIEPLNTIDFPDSLLHSTAEGLELIRQVGHPHVKLQYDVYHSQMMNEALLDTITRSLPDIRHIQIADAPGRHQPGTGSIDYPAVLRALEKLNYSGYTGLEYLPATDTASSLEWIPSSDRGDRLTKAKLLGSLPREWPRDLLQEIAATVHASRQKIVVLDDDPTGTQTVYGVPVLTEWSLPSLTQLFVEPGAVAYILTNSRSVPADKAREMNRSIAENLALAANATGREFVMISRSDSTLRGHYPAEVHALIEGSGLMFDATLIIPCFFEGGRLTISDTHYVQDGDRLIPAAETEYARDATFGYKNSNLRSWVSEKCGGHVSPDDVLSISIEELRRGGPPAVAQWLEGISGGKVCIVNAASYRDLEVFVAGLLRAEAHGKRFIYRTAASFVRIRGGLPARPLLDSRELSSIGLHGASARGLVVAGSYIQKSSAQIAAARALPGVCSLEVQVERLLDPNVRDAEIRQVAAAANEALTAGKDTMVFTSRKFASDDINRALEVGSIISDSLVDVVHRITERPAWIIAKGGITSADVAVKGLGIKRAEVIGQAFPGVPVWLTGADSRWPGLLYAVFPGNVGDTGTLAEMIQALRNGRRV
jgi:hydroxypyruvate isomerase/uncharacterized protein YgbK (DUF1537 family)